jgi:Protein of unknown function (DUF3164)
MIIEKIEYMENASGSLIPISKVKDVDKLRDSMVKELFAHAARANTELVQFKKKALEDIAAFVSASASRYDAKIGGEKGNVTLLSFDGRMKIQRAVAETIVFDEGLQAAQALISECLKEWTQGGNDNIKAVVNQAFKVDKEGKVSTSRVLSLRSLDITDTKWLKAMQAIGDSMTAASSKSYLRFYQRDDKTGEYLPISLDIAGA